MKSKGFLKQLKKEGKLAIVEPSEEIKDSYLTKSESNLASSKILLENEKLEESISLAYYIMYNILTSLLFKIGIKSTNHSGGIILLKEIFGIDNSKIEFAKKERIDKQYYADFKITKKDAEDMIKTAEGFNAVLREFIDNLNNEDIERYGDNLREILEIRESEDD